MSLIVTTWLPDKETHNHVTAKSTLPLLKNLISFLNEQCSSPLHGELPQFRQFTG